MLGIAFASTANWSEVTRFTGGGGATTKTEPFTCNYVEWRIRWEFDPRHWHFPQLHIFSVTTYPQDEDSHYVDSIYEIASGNKTGTHYINDNAGTFYMQIDTCIIDSYTIIVEQNTDSIPEFPSWALLLVMVVAVLVIAVIYRRKLHNWGR
jgi:hypothetical protein